jgi:hypothetical protein
MTLLNKFIPKSLSTYLSMLGTVTNILETKNLNEVECDLKREVTKQKLINDSQMSQRHLNSRNAVSSDDVDQVNQGEDTIVDIEKGRK